MRIKDIFLGAGLEVVWVLGRPLEAIFFGRDVPTEAERAILADEGIELTTDQVPPPRP